MFLRTLLAFLALPGGRGTLAPWSPPTCLVVDGLYRDTRTGTQWHEHAHRVPRWFP